MSPFHCLAAGFVAAAALWAFPARSAAATPDPLNLKQAFDAAWLRQPEAMSETARRDAAFARRDAAAAWTPEPIAIELSSRTDRYNGNEGARENVAGIAVPLWQWGERGKSGALAEAEFQAANSRTLAARLRLAAVVRESYWQWRRAVVETDLARARLDSARRLAADVARRVAAGDLARSDSHQADGMAAAAESALADAEGQLASASQQLCALAGVRELPAVRLDEIAHEAVPDEGKPLPIDAHPALAELRDREGVAARAADLASVQALGNPELALSTTRERPLAGEPYQQSLTLGLRIPLGSDARHRSRVAAALAEATEARAARALEGERIESSYEAARLRVTSARMRLAAAEKRARLAGESRGFFDKSFRLGETDLPTRLRAELEAVEADRQALAAHIELASSISTLRQALGLLPE